MYAFAMLIDQIINLYIWTLLAYLATSWLIAFKIISSFAIFFIAFCQPNVVFIGIGNRLITEAKKHPAPTDTKAT